ncbi:MAG: biopolymer transporter ExbD [Candidatus Omnitrophica bacterium]|nr:biopolymer transporter ExbD [Candidatus Omnitrophota bacterium]
MRVKFKKTVGEEVGLRQIDIAPLIDVVFQLLIFFMLTSSFISIPGINVKLPKTVTQEALNIQTLTIVITAEDILYVEGKPIVFKELEEFIKKKNYDAIFIKADKDASLGVLVEVWDICKRLGIEKIGIATTAE